MKEALTLLAVFAHPDDESFGPAATLAKYVAEGVRITLLCATRGEAGEISDPQLATPETLGEVREEELRCACRVIGIQEPRFLGYRDDQMSSYDPQEVEGKVVRAIREVRPQVVLTFGPDGISGHLDHITIGKATTDAFFSAGDEERFSEHIAEGLSPHQAEKLYYVAVPRSRFRAMSLDLPGTCDDRITTVIDVVPFLEVKKQALACHKTQLPPGNLFAQISDEEMRKWWGKEHFVLAASRVGLPSEVETDLFWGLGK
ncbi:MAG TPA: PIG-L domain-containing protein [Chloroflexi bacterium]|nr:PIG-L domain-containing protein [Chloroflexota bacterium]